MMDKRLVLIFYLYSYPDIGSPDSELNDVNIISEWQTIPGQWPWQTDASALSLLTTQTCTAFNWSP